MRMGEVKEDKGVRISTAQMEKSKFDSAVSKGGEKFRLFS
jgi:hypothetical protein